MKKLINGTDEFTKKYGFSMTIIKPHPDFKDEMKFEGLEADYIFKLEQTVEHLKKLAVEQRERIDWYSKQEYYRLKRELDAKNSEQ